jgi:hypothetical protein
MWRGRPQDAATTTTEPWEEEGAAAATMAINVNAGM